MHTQTCRKSAVPRSDRSFFNQDRLSIGSYRSECPTRFFMEVLLDRDRDLNIRTWMARWRLRCQFTEENSGLFGTAMFQHLSNCHFYGIKLILVQVPNRRGAKTSCNHGRDEAWDKTGKNMVTEKVYDTE